jgi:hypothetical protein
MGECPIVRSGTDEQLVRMLTILLVILVLMAIGSAPAWPHSRSWGYYPSGGIGLVVVILLVLMLTGNMRL